MIILAAHGSQDEEARCMQLGAFAFLKKPVDIQVLSETLRKAKEKIRLESQNRDRPDDD